MFTQIKSKFNGVILNIRILINEQYFDTRRVWPLEIPPKSHRRSSLRFYVTRRLRNIHKRIGCTRRYQEKSFWSLWKREVVKVTFGVNESFSHAKRDRPWMRRVRSFKCLHKIGESRVVYSEADFWWSGLFEKGKGRCLRPASIFTRLFFVKFCWKLNVCVGYFIGSIVVYIITIRSWDCGDGDWCLLFVEGLELSPSFK